MRKLTIVTSVIIISFLFLGCAIGSIMCKDKKERGWDIDTSFVQKNGQEYEIKGNLEGVQRTYTQSDYTQSIPKNRRDVFREKLGYGFYLREKTRNHPEWIFPNIIIHSFTFTKGKNRDTIPVYLYWRTYRLKPTLIDRLPYFISNENIKNDSNSSSFAIYAESDLPNNRPYKRGVRKLYVSYDIEIDGNRIVKQNIKYSRRLVIYTIH